MPQNQYGKESAEEFIARKFLESYLNLNLQLAEVDGTRQVDYNFSKDHFKCRLEVSRFTEQTQKAFWKGYIHGQEMLHFPLLRSHWILSARGIPKMKTLKNIFSQHCIP